MKQQGREAQIEQANGNKSTVYFIGNRDERLVKIGYTTSLDKRLKTIQTSSPFPVRVLYAQPGTLDDEKALHRKFASLRKTGEWFRLEPPIEQYIQNQKQRAQNSLSTMDAAGQRRASKRQNPVLRLLSFRGRIGRAAFWFGLLLCLALYFMMKSALDSPLDLAAFSLMLWIGLATLVKRYHDRNKSGWWVLIFFVPIIGLLWMLFELGFMPGTPGPNRYG